MNTKESVPPNEYCAVCGTDTAGGRGLLTLHLDGRHIPLCCPLCQKVYEEHPAFYLRRLQSRETIRDIEYTLGWHNLE